MLMSKCYPRLDFGSRCKMEQKTIKNTESRHATLVQSSIRSTTHVNILHPSHKYLTCRVHWCFPSLVALAVQSVTSRLYVGQWDVEKSSQTYAFAFSSTFFKLMDPSKIKVTLLIIGGPPSLKSSQKITLKGK